MVNMVHSVERLGPQSWAEVQMLWESARQEAEGFGEGSEPGFRDGAQKEQPSAHSPSIDGYESDGSYFA